MTFIAQAADLSPLVTLVAPQFAFAGVVVTLWIKGALIARGHYESTIRELKESHASHVATLVATYEDRLDDHGKLLDRAASDLAEADQERREAQALALRLAGVAEGAVRGH